MPRWLLALLLLTVTAAAQTTRPAMNDQQLLELARRELGPLFNAGDSGKYLAVHGLIESYFGTSSLKDRDDLAKQLAGSGVDANVIGRLIRVRRAWQDLSPSAYFINDRYGQHEVKYFLGIPAGYTRQSASPLVVILPTADAFLTDPPPDNKQVVEIYKRWIGEELARQHDAVILMPLLNLDELYGPSRRGMNTVIQPMLHAAEVANIDPARVYLMGHSLGGHATWNLALHYPTYFAAVAPLGAAASGEWQRLRLIGLRNVLPVVWHDADDPIIPVESARSIVRALRGQELDVRYIETKKLGHALPPQVAGQVVESLRARTRELYPKEVMVRSNKPETVFNRADWVQIYQPVRPGAERNQLIGRGTGPMTVYQNTFTVKATIENNRLTATTDNTELMRFYFNDQMLDMSKAVSVIINGKTRSEGHLKPDVEMMLKDAAFLGRGWRYYSAWVDVDFSPPPTTRSTRPATGRP